MDRKFSHCIWILLCAAILLPTRTALQQFAYQDYADTLQPGKASLIYFSDSVSPSIALFLDELNKSAERLQDFGVSVAMVNCKQKIVSKYCGIDNVYLFRGDILLREFPKDTLFNVNAIVSNVLFALLFNEVKYITLFEEFQKTENAMKGNKDLVFTYVRATGTAEHRALMEAAFVYGSKYQFILTTELTVLAQLRVEEPDLFNAVLFFCHCKVLTDLSQPCKKTILEQSLTTLNIHRFFKLMEAPLVTLVDTDPGKISTVHLQLGLPLIFVISQKSTYDLDKATAEHIAWNLIGKAGIAIFLREISSTKIPLAANLALKRAEDGASITFLFVGDVEDISTLVQECANEDQMNKYVVEDEDEQIVPNQDDEVAEAVYRDRKRELDFQLILPLTEKTFYSTVTGDTLTVVLFYFKWEAVSVAFLQSYVEVTIALKGTPDILMAMINCGDWPTICSKERVLDFPHTRVYFRKKKPLIYNGMFGTDPLFRFIVLSQNCYATHSKSPPTCKNLKIGIHNPLFVKQSASEIFQVPQHEVLDYISELSVENLPVYLTFKRPLLILFSDGKLSHSDQMEISMLVKGKHLDAFCTCWLNLKKTPVGRGLLKQYFSSLPELPVLVLVNLFSSGYVFAFPTGQIINGRNILYWLNKISEGTDNPITLLSDKDWMPSVPHYDFLGMMDATMPNFASQKIPIHFSPHGPRTNKNNEEDYNKRELKEDQRNKNVLSPAVGVKVTYRKFGVRNTKSKGRLDL